MLSKAEIQEIARELILVHNDQYEYSLVYENEDLEDYRDDWPEIHGMMYEAKITVSFDEED